MMMLRPMTHVVARIHACTPHNDMTQTLLSICGSFTQWNMPLMKLPPPEGQHDKVAGALRSCYLFCTARLFKQYAPLTCQCQMSWSCIQCLLGPTESYKGVSF